MKASPWSSSSLLLFLIVLFIEFFNQRFEASLIPYEKLFRHPPGLMGRRERCVCLCVRVCVRACVCVGGELTASFQPPSIRSHLSY